VSNQPATFHCERSTGKRRAAAIVSFWQVLGCSAQMVQPPKIGTAATSLPRIILDGAAHDRAHHIHSGSHRWGEVADCRCDDADQAELHWIAAGHEQPNENVFCVHQSVKSLRRQSHFVMMAPCGVAHAEQSFQSGLPGFSKNPAKTKEIRAGIRQPAKECLLRWRTE
jgi:hypothetical protein